MSAQQLVILGRPAESPVGSISALRQIQSPIMPLHVTDPLNEIARVKICSNGNVDGSKRESPNYGEPSTFCLLAMVREFLEGDPVAGPCGSGHTLRSNEALSINPDNESPSTPADQKLLTILEETISCTDETELGLLAHVSKCVDALQEKAACDIRLLQGAYIGNNEYMLVWVKKHLQSEGYDAGICKSKRPQGKGFPAGDYEYVDVIMESEGDRVIVDTNFRAQFEIARPSSEYEELLQVMPGIFVGRAERLHGILRIMSEAAQRSMMKKGMRLPPWRKLGYLQAKWFSSYKRSH